MRVVIARPQWEGRTVVCIASGPSGTPEDFEKVRASGHPVIVTNTMFRACPWADALYAFDAKWWRIYHEEVKATFAGRKFGGTLICGNYGAEVTAGAMWFRQFSNSGACAVSLGISGKPKRVVLLAYDGGFWEDGKKHSHDDHPLPLGNASSMVNWAHQFDMLAKYVAQAGVEVVNASRRTRLTCFPRVELEAVL